MTAGTARPLPGLARPRERGAALVVGMILLLVLTVLGISGMITAALELQMAGNTQFQERAFQAAEQGIEAVMVDPNLSTNWTMANMIDSSSSTYAAQHKQANVGSPATDQYNTATYYDTSAGGTAVPGGGYSLGTGLEAYHFATESVGQSARGSRDTHTQSFYLLGPSGG
jgi:type IV pilus assembly protein PilX